MNDQRNQRKWANLYLVRHGESTCNEVNRFAGTIDAPLTPLGEAQARMAARRWGGPPPEIVFTSPLQRARRTAEILFPDPGPGADPLGRQVVDERLSERHFGDFTLQNKAFIQRDTGLRRYEAALYGEGAAPPNAESFSRCHARILNFLKEVLHPLLLAGKRVPRLDRCAIQRDAELPATLSVAREKAVEHHTEMLVEFVGEPKKSVAGAITPRNFVSQHPVHEFP